MTFRLIQDCATGNFLSNSGITGSTNQSGRQEAGTLYVVATPIGNLADMSERAIATLRSVTLIAAEDTRHSKTLLQNYQIDSRMLAYHDHSDSRAVEVLLTHLQSGESAALISDAGTPLISDPGYKLVRAAREAGIEVFPVPGPSAVTAALSVAGLPSDRFLFAGFLPAKSAARQQTLRELKEHQCTLVLYESPHRIVASVSDIATVFGDSQEVFLAREISKKFEAHCLGTVSDCLAWLESDSNNQRGEFVVLVRGDVAEGQQEQELAAALQTVRVLREELSLKKAVALASRLTGVRKNLLYDAALTQEAEQGE